MIKMKYKYTNKDTYNQYEGKKFEIGKPVDAIYVKLPFESDNGNPLIEALPRPRLDDEIDRDYEFGIKGYKSGTKDEFQSLTEMQLLREIRFKLPFFKNLEIEHYNCLVNSYRSRELMSNGDSCKVIGGAYGAASIGYNLLGYSGSGKSSALKILLSRYPIVSFYMRLQLDYLDSDKQVTLDSKCVEKIMNKYFSGLIKILSKRSKQSKKTKDELKVSEFERMRAIEDNDLKLNADIQAKLQEAEMQKQIIGEKKYEEAVKMAELEKYIVETILIFEPNRDPEIIKGCLKRSLTNNKAKIDNTKEEILQIVLNELKKKKTIKQEQSLKQVPRLIE